jgi:hypothetical protein
LDKNENLKTFFSFFPSVQVSDVTKPVFVSRNKLECLSIEVKCNPSLKFEGKAVSFTGEFDLQPQTLNLTEIFFTFSTNTLAYCGRGSEIVVKSFITLAPGRKIIMFCTNSNEFFL